MLIVGILGLGATLMLVRAFNQAALNSPLRLTNARVLEDAKGALLLYVSDQAATETYPGKLPCPEDTSKIGGLLEGSTQGYCTLPAVGRLPWRTLGYKQAPVDSDGEPLWYAVSPGFNRASSGASLKINSDTPAGLTVDGSTARAVALIFAPGRALSGQSRSALTPASPPAAADYLELENASLDISFATFGPASGAIPVFNDQVVIVTHQELFDFVEPAVAKRISAALDVAPTLQGVYASADWGGTATTPRFPFAAAFGDPETSNYTGAVATYQGLLPLSHSKVPGTNTDCVVATDGSRCNPNLVAWKTGAGLSASAPGNNNARRLSVNCTSSANPACTPPTGFVAATISVPSSSPYNSVTEVSIADSSPPPSYRSTLVGLDCNASTSTQISCAITYGRSCASPPCGSRTVQPRVRLTVRAQNVAKAFKMFDASAISASEFQLRTTATSYGASPLGVLRSDGDADITTEWLLPSRSCTVSQCYTHTITIPISLIADHALANSANSSTGWFLSNDWHKLTYYAISSGHAPGSTGNCVAGGSPACLTFNAPTGNTSPRALLILAGRAIRSQARPSSALANYLESENLSPVDNTFVKLNPSADFNDRVVVVY